MEHEQSSVEKFEKFTWEVEIFGGRNCRSRIFYSEPFVLCGYPWIISLYPGGEKEGDCLSIYLKAVETANMSEDWFRDVKFKLILFNQLDTNLTLIKESTHEFDDGYASYGFASFMTLGELYDSSKGFIVKDTCIVGAEVYVYDSIYEKRVNQQANLSASLKPKLEEGHKVGELMDFKGLGQIEKDFIPLLEEVCSLHPSLIESQQKRSQKFREWAFNALGRVLYFLRTKKVKDMNDITCKSLQDFWEELQHFSFDLTWLEPHVNSALEIKSYFKKLEKAKKLKDNVVALQLEMETHKDTVVALELEMLRVKSKINSLELNIIAARDLLIVEDLKEIDLEAELGFVKP